METLYHNALQHWIQNGRHEKSFCSYLIFFYFWRKKSRTGGKHVQAVAKVGHTYVGPDFDSSLFATVQKLLDQYPSWNGIIALSLN